VLAESYHSTLVREIKENDYQYASGRLTIHLAREFGFCYGVDRAVDYAYQTRKRFPDRHVYLTGEIIHNPHVNNELRAQGIRFLSDPGVSIESLGADDVVILPAFGVTIEQLAQLEARGCSLVDTTCGSVLNVWKNVRRYADEGFTSIIHGKYRHEETRATASQARRNGHGHYLVVYDRTEALEVCEYIRHGGSRAAFLDTYAHAASPGFDPDVHLDRIGCANQTTMLSSESLEVGALFRDAIRERYGDEELERRFRAFDTICSATQDRQDAILALLDSHRLDLVVVIGGYNSSNTQNLTRICAGRVPTYHIADHEGLVSPQTVRHRGTGPVAELSSGWLPEGQVSIGLTSGASTPDNIMELVIRRIDAFANR
jgi:4-hydroxy-3-methylbut-2-enyl diphosphate reductase